MPKVSIFDFPINHQLSRPNRGYLELNMENYAVTLKFFGSMDDSKRLFNALGRILQDGGLYLYNTHNIKTVNNKSRNHIKTPREGEQPLDRNSKLKEYAFKEETVKEANNDQSKFR